MMATSITARFQLNYGSFQLQADIDLPGSGISVLFGESGSGKTSLLRCMAGLERPGSGYFKINGSVWQDSSNGIFLPTHKRRLGYVFQEANLFPHLNVNNNLQFGLKRAATIDHSHTSLSSVIDLLGIGHLLGRMPDRLSGGEKQRVAIARALVLNPDILLMDEPLASLDLKRKQEVMPYLLKLQYELAIPIVYVTHSWQEVTQLANFLVMLDRGRVIAAGELTELIGRLDLTLAQNKEAASVWQGKVTSHDSHFQLTAVDFGGCALHLPVIDQAIGTSLRIQIQARDVSIARCEPKATSILNVLPATIKGFADDDSGHTVVSLDCGNNILLSHITRKSAQMLELTPGLSVFAQIKGTSLLH